MLGVTPSLDGALVLLGIAGGCGTRGSGGTVGAGGDAEEGAAPDGGDVSEAAGGVVAGRSAGLVGASSR